VLGPVGAALLGTEDRDETKWAPQVRTDRQLGLERSPRLSHMTGRNWFFAALAQHARQHGGELAEWLNEADAAARCEHAAVWSADQHRMPHPDGAGTWAENGQAVTFLLEYDTGTEHLPVLAAKLGGYRVLAANLAWHEHPCPVLLVCFGSPRREQAARRGRRRARRVRHTSRGGDVRAVAMTAAHASPAGALLQGNLSGTLGGPFGLVPPVRGPAAGRADEQMAPSLPRHTRGNRGISRSGREGRRVGRRRRRSTALDALPVVLLVVIAGPGPFTHIRAHRPTKATIGKPGKEANKTRLRVFFCSFCSTAEMVPWCGQNPDCGHPECTEALARCAALHRLDDRRFHGQVNVAIIERQLWERYEDVVAEEAS
jgi:hypothetical protein